MNEYKYEVDGATYEPVENQSCEGCAFAYGSDPCLDAPYCSPTSREDARSVIWVKVE